MIKLMVIPPIKDGQNFKLLLHGQKSFSEHHVVMQVIGDLRLLMESLW